MSYLDNFENVSAELRRTADALDAFARREAEARAEAKYYKKLYSELRRENLHHAETKEAARGTEEDHSTGSDRSAKSLEIQSSPPAAALGLPNAFVADPTFAVSPGRGRPLPRSRGSFSVMLRDPKANDSSNAGAPCDAGDMSEGQALTDRSLSMFSEGGRSVDSLTGLEASASGHGVCTTHWKGANYYLTWDRKPTTALVLCKTKDYLAVLAAVDVCNLLWYKYRIQAYVESKLIEEDLDIVRGHGLAEQEAESFLSQVKVWRGGEHDEGEDDKVIADFGVVLGGDGTVLWASTLFPEEAVPPLVAFGLGTLSFMCANDYRDCKYTLHSFLNTSSAITLRHRLTCCIVREAHPEDVESLGGCPPVQERNLVLNDVVIDRGVSPYLTNLECYCDDVFVTNVRGDGLIVATPSGSTAYSLAAGGSMVHPQVPCILFTPICPHSLSFRPLAFPNTIRLKIRMPKEGNNSAWVSFDGKGRQPLSPGDAILIEMSDYPLPTVCASDPTSDWFRSVTEDLQWNTRDHLAMRPPARRLSGTDRMTEDVSGRRETAWGGEGHSDSLLRR